MRIRRIYDDVNRRDRQAILAAQAIVRAQFPGVREAVVEALPAELRDPLRSRFRSILFSAEDWRGGMRGFALLHHAPDLDFCYLDFLSAARGRTGGGVGGALYSRVREEAAALGCIGLFFECLPDDPELCHDPAVLRQNADRLRFYEGYGAYPIAGTEYETPVRPGGECPPYLVYDDLGSGRPLARSRARRIVRAILERHYGELCPQPYIDRVVASFRDDPVRLREPLYARPPEVRVRVEPPAMRIALFVNEGHEIHHVRERGYVEAPVRIPSILAEIERSGLFERGATRHYADEHITAVHDREFVRYLKRVGSEMKENELVYPYVFPSRNPERLPEELTIRAGYYCIDTFTPVSRNAFLAARGAVDCALSAADAVLAGSWLAYALVRPPGHHAERRSWCRRAATARAPSAPTCATSSRVCSAAPAPPASERARICWPGPPRAIDAEQSRPGQHGHADRLRDGQTPARGARQTALRLDAQSDDRVAVLIRDQDPFARGVHREAARRVTPGRLMAQEPELP